MVPATTAVKDDTSDFSHLDAQGRAHMVDVGGKVPSARIAVAEGLVVLTPDIRGRLLAGDIPKGEVLAVARVAGIQAAKETARLIPLCHPLGLSSVTVAFEPEGDDGIRIEATATVHGVTGVEMEAMTAVSVAALTVYDMCKALHKGIEIRGVRLLRKEGGKSGVWTREEA